MQDGTASAEVAEGLLLPILKWLQCKAHLQSCPGQEPPATAALQTPQPASWFPAGVGILVRKVLPAEELYPSQGYFCHFPSGWWKHNSWASEHAWAVRHLPSLGAVAGQELQWWNASGLAYHSLKSKQIPSCDAGNAAGAGAHEQSLSQCLHFSAPFPCQCITPVPLSGQPHVTLALFATAVGSSKATL